MDLEKTLKKVGLTQNESKVYLALAKLGSSKAGRISKEASLNRTSTYNSLKSLLEKGLASYVIIGKVKWFQASDPRNLKIYLKNKLDELDEVLPSLSRTFSSKKLKESVSLFKGKKGVKTVLEDILSSGEENCIFGSEGQLEERMPNYSKKFLKKLKKSNVKMRSIVRKGRKIDKSRRVKVRFVPKDIESPMVTNIYKDKIALIIWSEPPEVVLIQNKMAAKAYKSYFELMWKNAEKR